MTDYKEMYLTLMRATEQANRILIEAQRKAEEIYLTTSECEHHAFKKKES